MPLKKSIILPVQYLSAIIFPILVAAIIYAFSGSSHVSVAEFLLILAISLLSMYLSLKPLMLTAAICTFLLGFIFMKPEFRFEIEYKEDIIKLLSFGVVTLLIVVLTYKIQQTEKKAREKEEKETILKTYEQMFISLSIELEQPAKAISDCAILLSSPDHPYTDSENHAILKKIRIASFYLNQQIETLLYLSGLESGIIQISNQWCDISEIMEQAVESVAIYFHPIKIELNVSKSLALVSADYRLLKIAIMNILTAAMQQADALSAIVLSARIENKKLLLSLENKNYTLPASVINVHPVSSDKVTDTLREEAGVGLSIVRTLIEAHNGELHVNSTLKNGSILTISIPVILNTAV